jgi:hypothetical protein
MIKGKRHPIATMIFNSRNKNDPCMLLLDLESSEIFARGINQEMLKQSKPVAEK